MLEKRGGYQVPGYSVILATLCTVCKSIKGDMLMFGWFGLSRGGAFDASVQNSEAVISDTLQTLRH